MIRRLDHVAVIVRDLEAALPAYRDGLGMRVDRIEDYGPGVLRIAFLDAGNSWVELIEPLDQANFNWAWLAERGEGLQHFALEVESLEAAIADLQARGYVPATPVLPGAGGTRIVFMQNSQFAGAMVELLENPEREGSR